MLKVLLKYPRNNQGLADSRSDVELATVKIDKIDIIPSIGIYIFLRRLV